MKTVKQMKVVIKFCLEIKNSGGVGQSGLDGVQTGSVRNHVSGLRMMQ